jgi:dienelactone hydrolase
VLVPQINTDRGSWRPQAEAIAGMGHLALAIDEDTDDRAASVRGAIAYLRGAGGVSTVVLVGASTGGEAVVVADATAGAPVDGTVTLSAAGGADRASDLRGRTLFVVSEDEEDRFVRVARELHQGAPEPTDLVVYDGSAHGQGLFASGHDEALRDRLRTLLSEVCGS